MTTFAIYGTVGLILGLLFGSFLNVCISRLPRHESIAHPPSHCPRCKKPIRWFDNIPVLSWIILRGRCRDCHARISWRYPIVEIAAGIWFARYLGGWIYGAYYFNFINANGFRSWSNFFNYATQDVSLAILGFLLIGLIVMDWQTQILPDAFTLTGIAIGIFLVCTQALFLGPHEGDVVLNTTHQLRMSSPGSLGIHGNIFLTGTEALVWGRVAAVLGAAAILLLVRWLYKLVRHREGLGLGDVKLIAMIAAFLGFWPAILALFLGVLGATAYALLLLVRRKADRLTRLPLGSFLAAGGLVAALFGEWLINSYTQMLR